MSEEILKALTQLFAIITKQDGGVSEKERSYVIGIFREDLDQDSIAEYLALYDEFVGYGKAEEEPGRQRLTSVKDSVKTLAICRKINKTLTQKQKIVVLIKLLELVGSDRKLTRQRMEIINTVSEVFNISQAEYSLIERFILYSGHESIDDPHLLLAGAEALAGAGQLKQIRLRMRGELLFLWAESVDMFFLRYNGDEEISLNGFSVKPSFTYHFSHGSTIRTPAGDALYYSDLIRHFISAAETNRLSFHAAGISKQFANGAYGLRELNIQEGPGKLIGIMGASGAGKTTLLNLLAGIDKPSTGQIRINGVDLHSRDTEKIKGVIGYISQDDLLIEELTVYENLYYNAKLCFADLSEEEIDRKVMDTLTSLGLEQRKDLRVGNALDKQISGGQRKRLNIALELIREPAVLFVDEPTSGLSSRDSDNVIDLLKELSLKGKLIFVVIHQPSSDIYKMFDKMMIMDVGGYPVFYGPPLEAVVHFKKATNQVGAERGLCPACGNVNPEQIFNIIDAKVVDEYGQFTSKRKVTPVQWHDLYSTRSNGEAVPEVNELPPRSLRLPNRLRQAMIFARRDLLSKLSNRQYMLINLLEAPLLAFILAFIIRYNSAPDGGGYLFRFNENVPVYIMMAIIVALFMGLMVSAEEIIKDRKILKRESFLNLSWNSYLLSKVLILFSLSAVQTLALALIGNLILGIQGMTLSYWLVLFSVSCMANLLGLNISSAFKSAVTVYILIPLLIIPQMVLSGLLFKFDKLNEIISTRDKVPVVADLMASRWAYEAIALRQFRYNEFERPLYPLEQQEMMADFKSSYWITELRQRLQHAREQAGADDAEARQKVAADLQLVHAELLREFETHAQPPPSFLDGLLSERPDPVRLRFALVLLDTLQQRYLNVYNLALQKKERLIYFLENSAGHGHSLNRTKDLHHNESLSDLVRNIGVRDRILEYKGRLLQQIDPVFREPDPPRHLLDYRTHFFAPSKWLLGMNVDTYAFNVLVIWGMSLFLYLCLYFEWLRMGIDRLALLSHRKKAKIV
jgi:ABC transport system ATP-binding/permease protein